MARIAATALAAVTVAAAAAVATAVPANGGVDMASTERMAASLRDAVVITLASDCVGACQDRVSASLTARGCTSVEMLPTLRMVNAVCPPVDGASADDVPAGIPGVLEVDPDELVSDDMGDVEADREGDIVIPIKDAAGMPYFWGLDRVNQHNLPLDKKVGASCYPNMGKGVDVFVVDSGCLPSHPEFKGVDIRTMALPTSPFDVAGVDDRGHGSHVAGTVAGWRTGVAPKARITCVKVLNSEGRGKGSVVSAGFEHAAAFKAANPNRMVIMQASISGSGKHHDAMAKRMNEVGVIGTVSAGNKRTTACKYTPARSPDVITVGNSDLDDSVWRNSNIGRCVDLFAPGHKILSVDFRGTLTTKTGTSMSAPHVAGMAALIMSQHPKGASLRMRDVLALLTKDAPMVASYPMAWLSPTCAGMPPPAPMPVPVPTVPVPPPAPPVFPVAPVGPPTNMPPGMFVGGIPPAGSGALPQLPPQM